MQSYPFTTHNTEQRSKHFSSSSHPQRFHIPICTRKSLNLETLLTWILQQGGMESCNLSMSLNVLGFIWTQHKHLRMTLQKWAKGKEWSCGLLTALRKAENIFSGAEQKVTHSPEGSQLFPCWLNSCRATVAEENLLPTVLPYFFSPHPSTLTAETPGHRQLQGNPTTGMCWKQKFQLQGTKTFKWCFLQHLSIQCDLQQLILFKSAGCLPLPSAGEGLKGTHIMHQQFAWMEAASAYASALPSLRVDLPDGQKHTPLTHSLQRVLQDM